MYRGSTRIIYLLLLIGLVGSELEILSFKPVKLLEMLDCVVCREENDWVRNEDTFTPAKGIKLAEWLEVLPTILVPSVVFRCQTFR